MKSFKDLMEIVAPDVKNDLKSLDATSFSKKHGKSKSEIKNTFESAEEKVPEPGREAVGGRFTSRPPKSVMKPAPQVTSEEAKDPKEYGYEGDMAMNQLKTITRHAEYLMEMMKPDTDLPEWVQSKITLAADYIQTACDYMTSEMDEAVNAAQQAAIAINMKKKGIKPKNEQVELEETMSNDDKSSIALKALVAKKNLKQSEGKFKSVPFLVKMKQRVAAGKKLKEQVEELEEMDKSQDPPGRDGGIQFPPGPKVSKKDIKAIKKDPTKHLSDLLAKEYAKKKMKEEVKLEEISSGEYNDPISRMRKKDNEQKRNNVTDKSGAVHTPMSRARHLAHLAMQKQMEKMKKPVKESLEESRKAQIVKEIMKKKTKTEDTFQKDPELSSSLTKNQ